MKIPLMQYYIQLINKYNSLYNKFYIINYDKYVHDSVFSTSICIYYLNTNTLIQIVWNGNNEKWCLIYYLNSCATFPKKEVDD